MCQFAWFKKGVKRLNKLNKEDKKNLQNKMNLYRKGLISQQEIETAILNYKKFWECEIETSFPDMLRESEFDLNALLIK